MSDLETLLRQELTSRAAAFEADPLPSLASARRRARRRRFVPYAAGAAAACLALGVSGAWLGSRSATPTPGTVSTTSPSTPATSATLGGTRVATQPRSWAPYLPTSGIGGGWWLTWPTPSTASVARDDVADLDLGFISGDHLEWSYAQDCGGGGSATSGSDGGLTSRSDWVASVTVPCASVVSQRAQAMRQLLAGTASLGITAEHRLVLVGRDGRPVAELSTVPPAPEPDRPLPADLRPVAKASDVAGTWVFDYYRLDPGRTWGRGTTTADLALSGSGTHLTMRSGACAEYEDGADVVDGVLSGERSGGIIDFVSCPPKDRPAYAESPAGAAMQTAHGLALDPAGHLLLIDVEGNLVAQLSRHVR